MNRMPPATLLAGIAIVALFIFVALVGPLVLRGDPTALDLRTTLASPDQSHLFGTDNFGRDVLLRTVYATRLDLAIGLFCVVPVLITGSLIGALAGYLGGPVDALVMRIVDIVVAFPFLVLIIAIVAVIGPSLGNMFVAVWMVGWVGYARLVRSEVMIVKQLDYVSAARVLGYSHARILARHVMPNVALQPLVYATSDMVGYILLGSALGYLGLGVQPPTPEWGTMIAQGRNFLVQAPWIALFPGLSIVGLGMGLLLLGDGLADFLRVEARR